MPETKIQVWKRKIRNGRRKEATKVQKAKERVWDLLSDPPQKFRKVSASFEDGIKQGELQIFMAKSRSGKSEFAKYYLIELST